MIPIFLAVDTADFEEAAKLLIKVGDEVDVKLGLEFFIAHGPSGCNLIRDIGATRRRRLFLDLKLHDIPATVAGAVKSAMKIEPDFITIHCGDAMREAVRTANHVFSMTDCYRPTLLGVTLLTSEQPDPGLVTQRSKNAFEAGMDGLVCSASDVAMLRQRYSDPINTWAGMFLMVPGIRSAGADTHDQVRVATAREAMDAGASALVIGREIKNAADPAAAARTIKETLR